MNHLENLAASGLYRPAFERDNCGFGLIAQMDGRASHWLVNTAIQMRSYVAQRLNLEFHCTESLLLAWCF